MDKSVVEYKFFTFGVGMNCPRPLAHICSSDRISISLFLRKKEPMAKEKVHRSNRRKPIKGQQRKVESAMNDLKELQNQMNGKLDEEKERMKLLRNKIRAWEVNGGPAQVNVATLKPKLQEFFHAAMALSDRIHLLAHGVVFDERLRMDRKGSLTTPIESKEMKALLQLSHMSAVRTEYNPDMLNGRSVSKFSVWFMADKHPVHCASHDAKMIATEELLRESKKIYHLIAQKAFQLSNALSDSSYLKVRVFCPVNQQVVIDKVGFDGEDLLGMKAANIRHMNERFVLRFQLANNVVEDWIYDRADHTLNQDYPPAILELLAHWTPGWTRSGKARDLHSLAAELLD